MTHTMRGSVGTLRAAMSGPVIGPADPDYDQARRVWNAGIDRHPAVIARCALAADVAAAVTFAAVHGLEITVRGGAHSMSGASVADGGLVIDLSQLNQVSVDPQAKLAWAGGARCSPAWTPRPRPTALRCPPAWSVTPVSAGSPSAAAWGG